MDKQEYLQLLKEHGIEKSEKSSEVKEDTSSYYDSDNKENPYSQKELQRFIQATGYKIDDIPKFTEMAKKMNPAIKHPEIKKDLTNLDNHDIIEDISPIKKNAEREYQVKKEALKKLIAKYRG